MVTNSSIANVSFPSSIGKKLQRVGLSPLSLVMFILLGAAPFLIEDRYIIHLLITSLMFGTLAMGFDLSAGFIDIANWGYAGLMGVGGYTSALLAANFGVSPWIGISAGAVLAALLGLVIGILTLRMNGMFAAILAWFVGLVLMALATSLVGLTRGALGLNVDLLFDTADKTPYFYVMFIIAVITFMILRLVTRSNLGLAFTALGQDVEAARVAGVDPMKYKVFNFTISCSIAGLVGGFYAHFMGILTPDVMATKHTVEILVIAYLGGRGSIWGPLFAAFLIIPVFEYLKFLMEIRYVVYGFLLVLVMIFYPSGISGLSNNLVKSVKKMINNKGKSTNGNSQIQVKG